ncbi:unnamed protein product, partial [Prorocentrum cordatum]
VGPNAESGEARLYRGAMHHPDCGRADGEKHECDDSAILQEVILRLAASWAPHILRDDVCAGAQRRISH